MLIQIDKGSRKLLKDVVIVCGEGLQVPIADDQLSVEFGGEAPIAIRARILVPIRFGSHATDVSHDLPAGSGVRKIGVALLPARLEVVH